MQCDDLKSRGIIVIKVFSIDDDFDFKTVEPYKDVSDYFYSILRENFMVETPGHSIGISFRNTINRSHSF